MVDEAQQRTGKFTVTVLVRIVSKRYGGSRVGQRQIKAGSQKPFYKCLARRRRILVLLSYRATWTIVLVAFFVDHRLTGKGELGAISRTFVRVDKGGTSAQS